MRKGFLVVFVFFMLLSPSLSLSRVSKEKRIIFNCDQIDGDLKSFSEINAGPLPNHDVAEGVDLSNQYQQIGIDMVRTHDFSGPTDISTMFPDFSKDPTLVSSYNFTSTDEYITGIIDAGGEVFFRMGESASTEERLRQPPADFEKWAEICKHVLMHYTDGWADGFFYDISYVEIWNEPDLAGFFNGSADEYYQLYETTASVLKAYDSTLRIGGPCTSSLDNENFTTGFLDFVKDHDAPLDFYSWHRYADHPGELFYGSLFVRNLLDAYGFFDCENINTEWNINIIYPQRDKDNARNAAFTACSLSLLQDAAMDKAFRYRGTGDNNWLTKFIGFDLSLFTFDGQYKTPGLVYRIMNLYKEEMPHRLSSSLAGMATNITTLAGIAESLDQIGVLMSNYEQESFPYTVEVNNISWGTAGTGTVFVIDDEHDFEIINQFTITKNTSVVEVSSVLEKNSVQFIYLTNTSMIPEEGPMVYDIPWLLKLRFLDPIRALLGVALLLVFFG